jgi:hypothetical protein
MIDVLIRQGPGQGAGLPFSEFGQPRTRMRGIQLAQDIPGVWPWRMSRSLI